MAAILLILWPGMALAGVNAWTCNGPPDSPDVTVIGIAPSNPSVVYASSRSRGLLKSEDGGRSWVPTALESNVVAIAVDPTNPSVVYVNRGGPDALSKSTDGGATWTDLHASGGWLVIDPTNPSTIYSSGGAWMIKSTNAGASWIAIGDGLTGEGITDTVVIDPASPSTLYVATYNHIPPGSRPAASSDGGIFKSTDGGIHWVLLYGQQVYNLAIDPGTPSTLYALVYPRILKSVNAGATWTYLPTSLPPVIKLWIVPQDPSTLFVTTYDSSKEPYESRMFKSSDGGASFTPVPIRLLEGNNIFDQVLVNPRSPASVYGLLRPGLVIRSTNGGNRWFPASRGLATRSANRVAVSGSPPEVYAGTENRGLFRGVDGGRWWRSVGEGQPTALVGALSVDPTDPSTIYRAPGVWRSRDGGETWTDIEIWPNLAGPAVQSYAVDPATPSTVYAGTSLGVYKSIDRGSHWIETVIAGLGTGSPQVGAVAVDPKTTEVVYAASYSNQLILREGGVFRSADGGQTWNFGNAGMPDFESVWALAINPEIPGTVYAGGYSGVHKSTDSGANWSLASTGIPSFVSLSSLLVDPLRPDTLYASTTRGYTLSGAGVYRSTNGAQSWSEFNAGLPSLSVESLAIDSTGSILWAASVDAGVCRYEFVPDPAVATIAPDSGPAAGGTPVTIRGSGFAAGATVLIGGVAATGVAVIDARTITALAPPLPAGSVSSVTLTNPDTSTGTLSKAWVTPFADLSPGHPFESALIRLLRNGITSGCGSGRGCPDDPVSRSEMAVFVLRARHGSGYAPPAATGTVFADVPATMFLSDWIEQFAAEGMTTGCGGGNFCPAGLVTRGQMAVFLLRGVHGRTFVPPDALGLFADVLPTALFARWIEALANEGTTLGCGGEDFCPDLAVTRGQMAAFLVRASGLP